MKLMQGDCLERMKEIPDGSVDMVMCDPPYGTTACKWDSVIPFEPMWEQLKRVTKKNGAIVMTASQPFTSALVMSNIEMFKYCWVWDKANPSSPAGANKRPLKYHEDVVVFYRKQPTYSPIKFQGKKNHGDRAGGMSNGKFNRSESRRQLKRVATSVDGLKFPRSIILIPKNSSQLGFHPTQKPVALMEYLIKTYTNQGETVLDFTFGSLTTGVACANLNRNFIGIEKDPNYFNIGVNRLKEHIKCLDLKIELVIDTGD